MRGQTLYVRRLGMNVRIGAAVARALQAVVLNFPHGSAFSPDRFVTTGCEGGPSALTGRLSRRHPPVEESCRRERKKNPAGWLRRGIRSEEHTSELQSLMRISYAVFCLKKKINNNQR